MAEAEDKILDVIYPAGKITVDGVKYQPGEPFKMATSVVRHHLRHGIHLRPAPDRKITAAVEEVFGEDAESDTDDREDDAQAQSKRKRK